MDGVNLRNFKDFMLLYNETTETCFNRCVNNFNSRKLANDELFCAETCASKQINLLNRIMSSYLDVQNDMLAKRIAEAQQTQNVYPTTEETANALFNTEQAARAPAIN